jgi:hypothetical protein
MGDQVRLPTDGELLAMATTFCVWKLPDAAYDRLFVELRDDRVPGGL